MTPDYKRRITAEWHCNYALFLAEANEEGLESKEAKKQSIARATEKSLSEYKEVIEQYVKLQFGQQF